MLDNKILDALENVNDAKSFIAFLHALSTDWENAILTEKEEPSSPYASFHGWENTSIGSFLRMLLISYGVRTGNHLV